MQRALESDLIMEVLGTSHFCDIAELNFEEMISANYSRGALAQSIQAVSDILA